MEQYIVDNGSEVLEIFRTEEEAMEFIRNHPDSDLLSIEFDWDANPSGEDRYED